jgi:signal transduction histidine kinase
VLRRWEAAVRELLPSADALTLAQVRDHLPQLLDQAVETLESCRTSPLTELVEITKGHGALRYHQQFNVKELILEYRVLRRILLEEVNRGLEGRLKVGQVIALNMGIDTVLQHGLMAFIAHQGEQLRAAGEVQSRYLSYLSHDLRNNLNGCTLMLEVLRQRLSEAAEFAEDARDIETVQRSITETIAGMDRILQAERLRREAVKPTVAQVDLQATVQDVARAASHAAERKGLLLRVDVPHGSTLQSDRELIVLALQNLVGNAVKYSRRGTVTVTARAVEGREPVGSGWEISVSDEGPGIGAEHRNRLFDAFSRGETHGQPGVGLGLAIASQATKLLGGTLSVESEVGKGSTFRLFLPGMRKGGNSD